jgi:hypothetical protein
LLCGAGDERVGATVSGELIVKLAPGADPDAVRSRGGVRLAPLHPGTSDAELSTYFLARVEAQHIQDVAERLMRVDGVDSAYVKPPAAAP